MGWWLAACVVGGATHPVAGMLAALGAFAGRRPVRARLVLVALGLAVAGAAHADRAVRAADVRLARARCRPGRRVSGVVSGRVDRGRFGTRVGLRPADGRGLRLRAFLVRFDVAPGDTVEGTVRAWRGGRPRGTGSETRPPAVRLDAVRVRRRARGLAWRAHETARWRLHRALGPRAGLAVALVVGERGGVPRDVRRAIDRLGVAHLFALSGLHLAVVALLLGRLMRRRDVRTSFAGVVLLAVGAAVAGAVASLWRAWWMVATAAAAHGLGRPVRARDALGAACALMLLDDPSRLDDLGFRMSVLATAVLVVVGPPVARRVPSAGRARAWGAAAGALAVSGAVVLALAPVETAAFGGVAVAGPVATLVLAPAIPVALASALVVAALPPALVPAGATRAVGALFAALERSLVAAGALAPGRVPVPAGAWAGAVALAALTVTAWRRRDARRLGRRRAGPDGAKAPGAPRRRETRLPRGTDLL